MARIIFNKLLEIQKNGVKELREAQKILYILWKTIIKHNCSESSCFLKLKLFGRRKFCLIIFISANLDFFFNFKQTLAEWFFKAFYVAKVLYLVLGKRVVNVHKTCVKVKLIQFKVKSQIVVPVGWSWNEVKLSVLI